MCIRDSYHIAPDVYHELGATVVCGGNTPDGFNINEGVGATHTETLPDRVQKADVYKRQDCTSSRR